MENEAAALHSLRALETISLAILSNIGSLHNAA